MHSRNLKGSSNTGAIKGSSHVNAQMSAHEDEIEDLGDVYSKIRVQIQNWLSSQTNMQLRQVNEHTDYKIEVERHSNGTGCRAAIHCMLCQKKKHIYIKNGSIKLSNWTNHIKGLDCMEKQMKSKGSQKKKSNVNQLALTDFLKKSCTPSKAAGNGSQVTISDATLPVKCKEVPQMSISDISNDPDLSPPEPGIPSKVALPDVNSEVRTAPNVNTGISNTASGLKEPSYSQGF